MQDDSSGNRIHHGSTCSTCMHLSAVHAAQQRARQYWIDGSRAAGHELPLATSAPAGTRLRDRLRSFPQNKPMHRPHLASGTSCVVSQSHGPWLDVRGNARHIGAQRRARNQKEDICTQTQADSREFGKEGDNKRRKDKHATTKGILLVRHNLDRLVEAGDVESTATIPHRRRSCVPRCLQSKVHITGLRPVISTF